MSDDSDTELISCIKLHLNDLKSEELFKRKNALTQILKKTFPKENTFAQSTYHEAFTECQMQIMKSFRDKSEMNRNLAIQIMLKFIENLELNDYYLTYIFPVLVERIGSVEIIEESEEIRLELVYFLSSIIKKYTMSDSLVPFLNDCIQILCQSVVDGYPKIKEASCNCIMDLAKALPRHFHMQCDNLIKPVLKAFTHQHFRIRVIAIRTICCIILHSTSHTIIENTMVPLAERLFDQNPIVRKEVGIIAAQLLCEYRDRYSFFFKILPLILTPLSDDIPDVREHIAELWSKVGIQFANENEKDLKEQLDFPVAPVPNYPPYLKRPNLGCRSLVQRHASKIYPGISAELSSWQEDIRIRCSQLLCVIVVHCEHNITQGLQNLLPAMYNACEYQRDQQKTVHDNVMRAAQYIGIFVPVKAWSVLVIPATTDAPTCGHLRILRAMASGTRKTELEQISEDFANLLALESVRCGNRKPVYQNELIECCRTLVEFPAVASQLFTVLVTVVALTGSLPKRGAGDELSVGDSARELLRQIPKPNKQVKMLLDKLISEDAAYGSVVSTDRCIFNTLLVEWSEALVPHLSIVGKILMRALDEKCDAETRLKTFEALSRFLHSDVISNLMTTDENKKNVSVYMGVLIKEILVPALIWRAGRTAEALRIAASFCLYEAIQYAPSSLFSSSEFFTQFLSVLISLTDDASPRTRNYCSRALAHLGKLLDDNEMRAKWANDSSVALVKRLDDPNETVRHQIMKCLQMILEFPKLISDMNLKFLIDSVLTHIDDQQLDKEVAILAMDVLKTSGKSDVTYMEKKLEKDKHLFRNKDACEELLNYFKTLSTN